MTRKIKDTRTKAQKQQAKAEWARKRAAALKRLSQIKARVGGREFDPFGRVIDETTVISQLQHLLVNDDRAVSRQAEEMGLSPGTVQRLRFGLTSRPSFRTVARMMLAKGVALRGDVPSQPRRKT